MSSVLREVLSANQKYSESFGEKANLALPPARRFAVLTCMDARLDPAKYAGLIEGDAHVIRNAGGRASDDAIRSLVISYKLLGTREFFIIHHTDCGMEFFTNEIMRGLLKNSLETAELTPTGFRDVGKGPGSPAGEFIDWLTISDEKQAVVGAFRLGVSAGTEGNQITFGDERYRHGAGEIVKADEASAHCIQK